MDNKTIIEFSFCDNWSNQGLRKYNQPRLITACLDLDYSGYCKNLIQLLFITAQVIIEMRTFWLVKDCVMSRYNHFMWGDFNTETLILKMATVGFLDISKECTNKTEENAISLIISGAIIPIKTVIITLRLSELIVK